MAKKLFFIVVLFSAIALGQGNSLYTDVTIQSSDEKGITLEFRPHYFGDINIVEEGITYKIPQFKFRHSSSQRDAGKEEIGTRVLSIALPSYQGNIVSIVASDIETIHSYSLAPVPNIEAIDNLGTIKNRYKAAYISHQNFYPAQIVELKNIGMVKGILTGDIVIAPYQFQSSSKTLKRYSRIVVRVDFGARNIAFDRSANDEWAKASLLNYSVAKSWSMKEGLKKISSVNSLLSSGTWYKMEVVDAGMYKISASYLKAIGIEPSSLSSIYDIKIFGGNGRRIPEDLGTTRPADLPQIAVEYVDKNSNLKFDAEDYILFYGQGTTGWEYNPVQKQLHHYVNPYTFSNYYFLSIGANTTSRQLQNISVSSATSGSVNQALGKVFVDEEKFNFLFSGQQWFSPPMNANESRVISNKLTGRIAGTPVSYKYTLYSRSNANAQFILEESGSPIASEFIAGKSDFELNYPIATYSNTSGEREVTIVPVLSDDRSNIKMTYSVTSTVAFGFIDWLEIFYRQRLTASNDMLLFSSPDTNGTIEFSVTGFSTNSLTVYDVSDVNNVRKINHSADQILGSILFKDTLKTGTIRTYWAGTEAKYLSPKSVVKIANSNLHGFNGAEFIIVSHNDFKSEAVRLKNHKENLPGSKKLSTVVVDVDTIYNEFGIGMPDPTAIRDFIRYAFYNWSIKPKYVLFFGDASFDFRSVLQNDRSFVPTYQTAESNDKIYSLSNEDYFSYLDGSAPGHVSIAHGRLTPRSADDARLIVDKIIKYELSAPKGVWKNVITIVADDKWASDNQDETLHTFDAESLADVYTPKDFEIHRIYMEEYPVVYTSSGRRKPDVRKEMLDQVNDGSLILNFIGHGNPKVWAHESILTLDDVRNQFQNQDKLTFIVAATCDWGRFEEAGESSSAEEVMFNKKGGAIGVLSATRAVFSTANAETNQYFYGFLFAQKPVMRLGDAYLLTKNVLNDVGNKQKYFLMGDPTLQLAVPTDKIFIDSLQTSSSAVADTMHALEKITIKATVRDTANAIVSNYTGSALLTVFDADRTKTISTIAGLEYHENGGIMYKGESSVKNGVMRATFIVPKDIVYANKKGRISIYFSNTASDGRGYTSNFIVGGASSSVQPDSLGPDISIFFDNKNFRSGDVVTENPTLIVSLTDSSGINSSTNSIGHRMEAWIDGNAKSVDLTEFYKGTIDSYQKGTAEYTMSGLSVGNHSINIRAWDVHNNSSSAESYFTVASSSGLSIQQLYNFPNPVSTRTAFTFQHNQLLPIDVAINIYTVSGRLIHKIERFGISERFVKIDWNRIDTDGDEVGNGIYFYKVIAKTVDGRFTSEAIGKMAIVR
ncbi:MAG: type IX secretion system sortase PorU [Bacteroidota bacterium]